MSHSNPKQIVALALVWAAALFGVDRLYARADTASSPRPAIRIVLGHGCAGCAESVIAALLGIEQSGMGEMQALEEPGQQVVRADVTDIARLDFVAIVEALGQAGFSVKNLLVDGADGHTLAAQLPHSCGARCEGVDQAIDAQVKRQRNMTRGAHAGWIAGVRGMDDGVRMTIRLDAGTIDVMDALRAIEAAGFSPRKLELEKK